MALLTALPFLATLNKTASMPQRPFFLCSSKPAR